jgi:hypothetical protein
MPEGTGQPLKASKTYRAETQRAQRKPRAMGDRKISLIIFQIFLAGLD